MNGVRTEYEGCISTGETNTKAKRGRECGYVGFKLGEGEAVSIGCVDEEASVVVVGR